MPHHHHSLQQQQHFNYQQQQQHHHNQGFKNDQPILADYPSMPYSLPPHMPLMPGAPGPYHSQPAASHLPLAVPPLAPLSYPFYPRGEYDRPPPKSTELFDPKAPTASSSSSSTSASSAPYNPGPSLLEGGAPYYPGPSFNAAPSVRSYSASRSAAGGSASSAHPYAQQQQQQQRYQQQAAPTSAYGNNDGLSGPMGNMRIATPTAQPQQQQPWGDHSPLIYAPQAYHHSHARGGYGVVGNGGRGGGRGGAATNGPFGAGSGATPAAGPAASGTPDGNTNSTEGSKAGSLSGSGSGLRTEGGESTTKSDANSAAGEGEPISGQAAPRVVSFSHILEVVELSEEVQSNSAEVANIADRLKKAGATNVKSLSSSSIIAIFKNANAAKKGPPSPPSP
jgi:hypothetical protein